MSTNSRRRKAAREAAANHGPTHTSYVGANRAQRRAKMRANVRPIPPRDERRARYLRAADRAIRQWLKHARAAAAER